MKRPMIKRRAGRGRETESDRRRSRPAGRAATQAIGPSQSRRPAHGVDALVAPRLRHESGAEGVAPWRGGTRSRPGPTSRPASARSRSRRRRHSLVALRELRERRACGEGGDVARRARRGRRRVAREWREGVARARETEKGGCGRKERGWTKARAAIIRARCSRVEKSVSGMSAMFMSAQLSTRERGPPADSKEERRHAHLH